MTTIDISNLSESAAEQIARILSDDSEDQSALIVIRKHGESVVVADDGNAEVEYDLPAEEAARQYVADGDWGEEPGGWVTVYTWTRWRLGDLELDDTDRASHTVEIPVEEPDCSEDDHDWCSPFAVLGGSDRNPGVQGHGGGVICCSICRHCGLLRTSDTWAQNPETGEEGLHSVHYTELGEHQYSEAYERWIAESDS